MEKYIEKLKKFKEKRRKIKSSKINDEAFDEAIDKKLSNDKIIEK